MNSHKVIYVGFNDEGNHLHGFIDNSEYGQQLEFNEDELSQEISQLSAAGEDVSDYFLLQEKMKQWKNILH
ncbi:MAG: hypothetical protein HRU20_10100 [Pseudomonadales bacterium]|nr:hypothetical protein [Pseudomonadales bacterium]